MGWGKEENIGIYHRYIVYRRRWIRYIGKIYHPKEISVNIGDISKISIVNEKKSLKFRGCIGYIGDI